MTTKWNAGLYDGKHSFVWEKAKGVLELLVPKAGERILDIGCGTGHLTAEIAAGGAEVLGIDSSAEMIAEARKKHPGLRFEVMDARELASSGEFDAVFSNAALHWIKEAERVVEGVARALKPGGRFVAEFGGKGNIQKLREGFERAFAALGTAEPADVNPWYYPSVAEYAALLERHGLEVREASLFARPTKLEDGGRGLETWIRMFRQVFLDAMGEKRATEWIREVERQCRAELYKSGNWELDYRRLRIAAWKV